MDEYVYQLTLWLPHLQELDFAINQLEKYKAVEGKDFVIKSELQPFKNKDGTEEIKPMYAVWTTGRLPGSRPWVTQKYSVADIFESTNIYPGQY